jgi:hypothetical protein
MNATATKYFVKVGYSDLVAFEVVRIVSDKCIEIREMTAVKGDWKPEWEVGGFSGVCVNQHEQKWETSSNEANPVIKVRLQKSGKWQDANGNKYKPTAKPVHFYDFNF